MRTPQPRRRIEPLATQLLAFRDEHGVPLALAPLFPASTLEQELLHERIYHVIALALRAYMNTWYSKIAPRDQLLLPVVNRDVIVPLLGPLLATVTTAEGQERLVDLVLLHIPVLLATHVQTYWSARSNVFGGTSLADAYHARVPTLAVVPVDGTYVLNPAYTSALVDSLLILRLPKADYEAEAERIVIREVVARVVLGSVGKRLAAAWFYAQVALKLMGKPGEPIRWKKNKTNGKLASTTLMTLHKTYTSVLAVATLVWTVGAWLITFLSECPPPKDKYTRLADGPLALARAVLGIDGRSGLVAPSWPSRLAFSATEVAATLFSPVIDRLVPFLIADAITAKNGLRLIDHVERLLFPDGWPGPPPIEPTPEEARDLDVDFRQRVHEVLPKYAQAAVTALPGERPADTLIDVISDPGCTAHLVGILLTAIVGALIPELVEGNVEPDTAPDDAKPVEAADCLGLGQ
jgi:hypothetical protein